MNRGSWFGYRVLAGGVLAAAAICSAPEVLAQTPPGTPDTVKQGSGKAPAAELSPELRKHLAEMYQKMGDCLAKTDKSMQGCQAEVMKNCPAAEALGYCPLADGIRSMKHGKHAGMHHPKKHQE